MASNELSDHKRIIYSTGQYEIVAPFDIMNELVPKYGITYKDCIARTVAIHKLSPKNVSMKTLKPALKEFVLLNELEMKLLEITTWV